MMGCFNRYDVSTSEVRVLLSLDECKNTCFNKKMNNRSVKKINGPITQEAYDNSIKEKQSRNIQEKQSRNVKK